MFTLSRVLWGNGFHSAWRGTYCQPLSVVNLACREEGIQRVVAGDDESSNVDKELSGNVEEDEEEVETGKTENHVDLGNGGLLLKVVEGGVFGQLEDGIISTDDLNIRTPQLVVRARRRCCVLATCHPVEPAGAYLLVELRQLGLGSILDRHCEGWLAVERSCCSLWRR